MDRIDAFLAQKKIVEKTKQSYRSLLCGFFSAFRTEPSRLTESELREALSVLSSHLSPSSFARTVSVLRSYYSYLVFTGDRQDNPMATLRSGEFSLKKPRYLKPEEFERLIAAPAVDLRSRRDRVMVRILAETGLRISELVALDREDFCCEASTLVCGFGHRRRVLSLSQTTCEELEIYCAIRFLDHTAKDHHALFLGSRGTRLTRQGFWKNLKERAIVCGIPYHITPHLLRHSIAVHRLARGEDPEAVRALLGNVSTHSLREYRKNKA